tara:strand:+ start:344 stop:1912 length:1569 start_codon:yes stop_codon:yes gene_type:complete
MKMLGIVLLAVFLTASPTWTAGAGEEAITAGVDLENFTPHRTIHVSTIEELMAAVSDARAGDLIAVADGDYDNPDVIRIDEKAGTAQAPIVIRSLNRGRARIVARGGFRLTDFAYVAIEGFSFVHNDDGMVCRIDDSNHYRLTRNHISVRETAPTEQDNRRLHWVGIGGNDSHHNRIDHNLFEKKRNSGVMIYTGGSSRETGNMATRYDRIDHNHFRDFYPARTNGHETIRLGTSTYSHSSVYTIVEHNLFERCDGEAEIISVKTSDNTIRNNTFRNSRGMLTLRNCHTCLVENNYFLNDGSQPRSEGIRFYGQGHVIINNYLQGLGGSAIHIRTGDIERRTEPRWRYEERDGDRRNWGAYQRPDDALIAFNTIVNCAVAFRLGESDERAEKYPLPARNITIANNLITSDREAINQDFGLWENVKVEGNLFHSTQENANLGWALPGDGYRTADPQLVEQDELTGISTQSPAVDAAMGDYPSITRDIHGHTRTGRKDVGAIELATSPSGNAPLTPADVGPDAQ